MTSCEELWSRLTSVLISVLTPQSICLVINGHLALTSGTRKRSENYTLNEVKLICSLIIIFQMFKELECNSVTSCEKLWSRKMSVLIPVRILENVSNFSSISYFKILQFFNSWTYGTEL